MFVCTFKKNLFDSIETTIEFVLYLIEEIEIRIERKQFTLKTCPNPPWPIIPMTSKSDVNRDWGETSIPSRLGFDELVSCATRTKEKQTNKWKRWVYSIVLSESDINRSKFFCDSAAWTRNASDDNCFNDSPFAHLKIDFENLVSLNQIILPLKKISKFIRKCRRCIDNTLMNSSRTQIQQKYALETTFTSSSTTFNWNTIS